MIYTVIWLNQDRDKWSIASDLNTVRVNANSFLAAVQKRVGLFNPDVQVQDRLEFLVVGQTELGNPATKRVTATRPPNPVWAVSYS